MDTHFAPAHRAAPREIAESVTRISNSRILDTLMTLAGGLVAVLNAHRQIISVNDAYLKLLGIKDAEPLLGLRPGEALNCTHAADMPGGCGTSRHCVTCGAAIAIVSCQELDHPVEQKCMLTITHGERAIDKFFLVRAKAMSLGGEIMILLFMQDATMQQNRIALERVFLHDLSTLAGSILGTADVLRLEPEDSELHHDMQSLSRRLAREIKIQRAIYNNELSNYEPIYSNVPIERVLLDLKAAFAHNDVASGKEISMENTASDSILRTDYFLLMRILENMIVNALEATDPQGRVRLHVEASGAHVVFSVWNKKHIPEPQALRVFQRNFSTKKDLGHGLGTYCMKLFGEQVLGGDVSFSSSEADGTVFRLALPLE